MYTKENTMLMQFLFLLMIIVSFLIFWLVITIYALCFFYISFLIDYASSIDEIDWYIIQSYKDKDKIFQVYTYVYMGKNTYY